MTLLSTLLQMAPEATGPYLILGYVAMGAIGLAYVVSLWSRQRNIQQDLTLLRRLLEEDERDRQK